MTSFRELRHNHDFTALWVGSTVSELGTRVSMFVFPLIAYALTGSTVVAGIAGATELLGMALALLPAGVLADRVHRGRLMRLTAAAGVVAYASLVAACALDALTIPHLLAAGLVTGAATGVFTPAEASALRTVVPSEQMTTALSQVQARHYVGALVGGPLGGALYTVSRALPFLFNTVTFAVSWVLLGRMRADLSAGPRPAVRRRAVQDLAEGLRFIWQRPVFRVLLLWSPCANLVVNALFMAATLRLIEAGFPAWQIGLVETVAGACGILGALCAPWLTDRFPTGRLDRRRGLELRAAAPPPHLLEPPCGGGGLAGDRRVPQPRRQRRHRRLPDDDHPARDRGPGAVGQPVRRAGRPSPRARRRRRAARHDRRTCHDGRPRGPGGPRGPDPDL